MAFLSQVSKESFDLWSAHVFWMPLLVKYDGAFNPIDAGLLSAIRVMLNS